MLSPHSIGRKECVIHYGDPCLLFSAPARLLRAGHRRDACTWYSELKTDGKFGLSTENAVKEFQLKNKMNVDGKVGANTWNVLYTRYTAKHGLHVPYPGIALRSGSSGGTVRLVQQKLNSLGERLNADGRFGAATAAAVQRFQRRNGLTADGAVGKETWEKMF